jgi:hypothetical protein
VKRVAWLVANAVYVSLDCNEHKTGYRTAAQEFEEDDHNPRARRNFGDVEPEERAECIAKDQICQLYIYPDTPIGSVIFTHADPDICVEAGYLWLRKHRGLPALSQLERFERATLVPTGNYSGARLDAFVHGDIDLQTLLTEPQGQPSEPIPDTERNT